MLMTNINVQDPKSSFPNNLKCQDYNAVYTLGNQNAQSRSERPIHEKRNVNLTTLIEMAQEAGRCPCLELSK